MDLRSTRSAGEITEAIEKSFLVLEDQGKLKPSGAQTGVEPPRVSIGSPQPPGLLF